MRVPNRRRTTVATRAGVPSRAVTAATAEPGLTTAARAPVPGGVPATDGDWSPADGRTADRQVPTADARPTRAELTWALRTAVPAWVLARMVVGAALAFVHELASRAHLAGAAALHIHEGLLGWDSGWYESIARHGYGGAGHASLRFFPLVPALTRALSEVPGIGVGASLVLVSNASALAAVVLVAVLARRETADEGVARRAAWLLCLAPAAFTQVMGYAEGTLLALALAAVMALRARAWWWAGVFGLFAALARPVGVLVLVPAVIEGARAWRTASSAKRLARAAAVLGPAFGFGAFLGFVGLRYGDALAPLKVQQGSSLRGGLSDPLRTLAHDGSLLVHGHHFGTALHLPWVLLSLALTVVAFRCWPASYGALAAALLAVALTASNLDGFERYALSAFPLVLAAASVTAGERMERAALVLAAAGLALYAALAFTGLYVP